MRFCEVPAVLPLPPEIHDAGGRNGEIMKLDQKRDSKTFVYTNPYRPNASYEVWLTPITTRRNFEAWLLTIKPKRGGNPVIFVRYSRGQYYQVVGCGITPVSIKRYYPAFSLAGVI